MSTTKFNIGDLIAPEVDYNDLVNKTIKFIPFAPNQNSICTVKSIDMDNVLYVEEVTIDPLNLAFNAKCWRLVEPVGNLLSEDEINDLIEESTMVLI